MATRHSFSDIVDLELIQSLLDNLWRAAGIPVGILDLEGNTLVAAGWQEVCSRFHRLHPALAARCRDNDARICRELAACTELPPCGYLEYLCPNGLIDLAVPIRMAGEHVANLFCGQFLFEPPDEDFFSRQAQEYGLERDAYLSAVRNVPVFSRAQVDRYMALHATVAQLLTELGIRKTEQLRARGALHVSEQKVRSLFEHASDALFVLSGDGRIEEANQRAAELTGYHPHELTRMRVADLEAPEHAAPPGVRAAAVLRRGQLLLESELVRRDGRRVPVEVSIRGVESAGPPLLFGSARDVSERKQAERALAESRRRLETLLANLPGMAYRCRNDAQWTMEFVSEGCRELTGYRPGELVGNQTVAYSDLIHPDDRERVWTRIQGALCAREPFALEYRILRADGELRWVWEQGRAVYPEGGDLLALEGFIADITERKEAADALRVSDARFRTLSQEFAALLDGIPDAIVLIDLDMRVVWTNRFAAEQWQAPGREVAGQFCFSAWYGRGEPCVSCPVLRAFVTGTMEGETIRRPDGSTWELQAIPLGETDGKVTKVILIARDETERVRLREETEQAARLASLGELAAGVAHEINSPTGLIRLNASLLLRTLPDLQRVLDEHVRRHGDSAVGHVTHGALLGEAPALLAEIHRGAERIARIVEDLKNFACPSATREPVALRFNEVVQAAVRLTAKVINKATGCFQVRYAEDLPPISGNPHELEQVVVNLLLNASQALESRQAGISLETGRQHPGDHVTLRVRDGGRGIAAQDLPKITQPFFTTKRTLGGTGLGLSVSARIVEKHGGQMTFVSAPGEGTEVTVKLPAFTECTL